MALPSSSSISIDQIKIELGITGALSLTDDRVRALAGVPSGLLTLPNDLWGKSARSISISLVSSSPVNVGGGNYYDRYIFGVSVTGGGTPSSYSWTGDVSDSASTAQFSGPAYQLFSGDNGTRGGTVYVTVIIAGVAYDASFDFTYTVPNTIGV